MRSGGIKFLSLSIFLLIVAACQPATAEKPTAPSGPQAGAGMAWHDGSVLAYRPSSASWVSQFPITYRQYSRCLEAGGCSVLDLRGDALKAAELDSSPIRDSAAATEYCGFVGGSGVIGSGDAFLCEIKDPPAFAPVCDLPASDAEADDPTLEFTAADPLQLGVELQFDDFENNVAVKSSFCSGRLGGLTFDIDAPVTNADAYRVSTGGEDMDCAVVDGRLACTGGKTDSAVEVTICVSPEAGSHLSDGESGTCPTGYLQDSDGMCAYAPIDRRLGSPGESPAETETPTPIAMLHAVLPSATATTPACELLNYAYDPKAGSCKPLDEAFPCANEGEVRMLYGRCEPRCANGFTPDYKGGCLPCNAGLSSSGGLCYVCPDGMISLMGGSCVSYADYYKTLEAPKIATEQASVHATETALKSWWLTDYPKQQTQAAQTGEAMIQTFRAPWTQEAQTQAALDATGTALSAALAASATPTPGCPEGTSKVSGGPCLSWASRNATAEAAVIQTATAFKAAFLTEQAYTPTPGGSDGCPEGTLRDSTGACVPCPSDTIFDPVRWACVPVAAMWISSCPAGYYFDEKTGTCLAPSGKDSASCFGAVLNADGLAACYPAGCLAGSTLDTGRQCCQAITPPESNADGCVTFTVQMPACETKTKGEKSCGKYHDSQSCGAAGCNWDLQYNICK